MSDNETVNQTWVQKGEEARRAPIPGLLLVFSGNAPCMHALPVDGEGLELGRGNVGGVEIDDNTMSRKHARVRCDVQGDAFAWVLEDLGSRNGSAVDGEALRGEVRSSTARVLRLGDSLFLLKRDLRPFIGAKTIVGSGIIIGPTLGHAWKLIDSAASSGEILHVTGETGAGKELAARRFHEAGPRAKGPFIAVNCATIPANLAERMLFGAKKGAYSGADADVDGYVQAAHQGTLFLDELAELDLQVQAKLLRVLETREVIPLGATTGKKVNVSVVSATHGALRERVDDGRFRQDLFFRLGRPAVALPPLRERAEDIPWIVEQTLKQASLPAHVSFIEATLVREWPGNVRELVLETKEAARLAKIADAARVEAEHLQKDAGRRNARSGDTDTDTDTDADDERDRTEEGASRARAPNVDVPAKEVIERALGENDGNISRTARALGAHRTQLRRWMEKYGINT